MSFSYVSGNGENSVKNIFSGIYSKDKKLTPYKIPSGYFTEGLNIYDNRHLSKFDGKCYIDSDGEWTTNENTIYGNAAMTFLMAAKMAESRVVIPAEATSAQSAASTGTETTTSPNDNNDGGSAFSIKTIIIALSVVVLAAVIIIIAAIINKNRKNKGEIK